MTLNRFGAHTRSTAFALTLSQPMIERILNMAQAWEAKAISEDLATRYPWYRMKDATMLYRHTENFGEGLTELLSDATMRALERRGIVYVDRETITTEHPPLLEGDEPQCDQSVVIEFRLTEAGEALVPVLKLAGFETKAPVEAWVEKVPLHPDDRLPIDLDGNFQPDLGAAPPDRRLDLMKPGDEKYFGVIFDKRKHEMLA